MVLVSTFISQRILLNDLNICKMCAFSYDFKMLHTGDSFGILSLGTDYSDTLKIYLCKNLPLL